MPRSLTASDRSSLIRLASSLPAGSAERKAILAGLSKVSLSPSQIAKQIATEFAEDNGFPLGTRFPLAKIEKAVAKMLADGAVLDAEGITTLAAGDYEDREARYGQYEGYVEIDEILNSLM